MANFDLNKAVETTNLADQLEDDKLAEISRKVSEGYKLDKQSRREWEDHLEMWMKSALMYAERKTFPWPNASNVKYPLIATAAQQFAARAYPALVPNQDLVSGQVIGNDPDGSVRDKADRIGMHMTWQILHKMKGWEEDMDRLLLSLAIVGTCFKKTYYGPINKINHSELVLAKDLVVNYFAKSLTKCYRVTQVIPLNQNEVQERINLGIFKDVNLSEPVPPKATRVEEGMSGIHVPTITDETTPYTFLEQHTFIDLDDDGYEEPYVVTFEEKTEKVVRITARFRVEDIQRDAEGKILYIKPIQYFTKFSFIPNPDGSFYDIGFGHLLGGINEAVNAILNQLIDSGTLSNLQAGFISKGIRIKGGNKPFTPGEWKATESTGDDLRKGIFPLPVREPSKVLFELLGTMVQSGKELASIAEIMVGKMPGQNTPATTTMATIEQGMKVFTAIYKRIYRALGEEYQKLFVLNAHYMPSQEEFTVDNFVMGQQQSMQVQQNDYQDTNINVIPSADPTVVSDTQKLTKAQALFEVLKLGTVNPQVATKRYLEAIGETGIQELMTMPPPQPNPEIQVKMAAIQEKAQSNQGKLQLQGQAQQADAMFKIKELELQEKSLQLEILQLEIDKVRAQKEITDSMHKANIETGQLHIDHFEAHKPEPKPTSK